MRLGRLELSMSRKELNCVYCPKPIPPKELIYRLTGFNAKVQKNFSNTLHMECLGLYGLHIREKRGERRGRPEGSNTIKLTVEEAAERRRAMQYLSRYRTMVEDDLDSGNVDKALTHMYTMRMFLTKIYPPELQDRIPPTRFYFKDIIAAFLQENHPDLFAAIADCHNDPNQIAGVLDKHIPHLRGI